MFLEEQLDSRLQLVHWLENRLRVDLPCGFATRSDDLQRVKTRRELLTPHRMSDTVHRLDELREYVRSRRPDSIVHSGVPGFPAEFIALEWW